MRFAILLSIFTLAGANMFAQEATSIKIGEYKQEVAKFFNESGGLPSKDVTAIAVAGDGTVYAGTAMGLAVLQGDKWSMVKGSPQARIDFVDFADAARLMVVSGGAISELSGGQWKEVSPLPQGIRVTSFLADSDVVAVGTEQGLYYARNGACEPDAKLGEKTKQSAVFGIAKVEDKLMVATAKGIFAGDQEKWIQVTPGDKGRSYVIRNARGLAVDAAGKMWISSPDGAYCGTNNDWTLYTGHEGLPYSDFTAIAAGEEGVIWFGTSKGAIRYDGKDWEYRQGLRWLPSDDVRAIAVNPATGDAWIATSDGVGVIERKPMTLAEKAKYYEDEIDKYHRRTEYGYVTEVHLPKPGDKSKAVQYDTDNDGLWTSMYGAGECFAYGATKEPLAKERAKKAFEALRFLCVVTQGGNPPALPGFVARAVVATSERNPNDGEYSPEKDAAKRKEDMYWKVIAPRWPMSADGKWYWKCDTSSDELDGHYFFYAAYYDLVADTDEEKARVREVVASITDHMVQHDFALIDHDGTPTRWAVFGPKELNLNSRWFIERGLNSLSMLSYLATAAHITGDQKYTEAFNSLVKEHGYAANMVLPKMQNGIGSGNQSDDEMAFMSFYNLIKYCQDPQVRMMAVLAFKHYWTLEQPEMNPFFNFAFAAACKDVKLEGHMAEYATRMGADWLPQSLDTLVRFPLDRVSWGHSNSHRLDIVRLPKTVFDGRGSKRGHRVNGLVLPVDERYFDHWNTDPWQFDYREGGTSVGPGTVYLLPYYMGLYHGFIEETK